MSPAELQAEALAQRIAQQRDASCADIASAAADEARALRAQAETRALRERRSAAGALRDGAREQLRLQAAAQASARRRAAAAQSRATLDAAWPQLAPALVQRWADPAARRRWCAAAVTLADRRLASEGRLLRHPADLPADEATALAGQLQARAEADPSLDAGLRIEADGAWVDASAAALLADRSRVEALLRAVLEAPAP